MIHSQQQCDVAFMTDGAEYTPLNSVGRFLMSPLSIPVNPLECDVFAATNGLINGNVIQQLK